MVVTREKATGRNHKTVGEMLESLARDGSLHQVGSRSKVPITEDDRHTAVMKALKVKNPQRFESERHLVNWMAKVMTNGSVDRFRRDQRQRPMPNTTLSQFVRERPRKHNEVVWRCLQTLPEQEQRILNAYYYDNCTDSDLAVQLFGTATTASSQRARRLRLKALELLKEKLVDCEL